MTNVDIAIRYRFFNQTGSPDQARINSILSNDRLATFLGLKVGVVPGAASHQFPLAPGLLNAPYVSPASAAASLVFTEGGATAFKAPAGGYQNTPGLGYNDAGFTSPQFNSPLQDFGTRLNCGL